MGRTYYYEPSFTKWQTRRKNRQFIVRFYCLFDEDEKSYHYFILTPDYDNGDHWAYEYSKTPRFPDVHEKFHDKGVPSEKKEEFFSLIKQQPPIVIAKIRMTIPWLTNSKKNV